MVAFNLFFLGAGMAMITQHFQVDALASSPRSLFRRLFKEKVGTPSKMPPMLDKEVINVNPNKHYGETHKDINNLLIQNLEFVEAKKAPDPLYFQKLGSVHKPKYLWIGCADARVPANEIMGEDAGSVFVVRNVANLVVGTDFSLMSALKYAMDVLEIPHIIVCGHYDCGGVRASMASKDHAPPLENWLRNIRDVYRLHQKELDGISDPEERHRRLVELNVVEQCFNLFKTGEVQRRLMQTTADESAAYSSPQIHACVFDPKDGILRTLDVDFKKYMDKYHGIYDLYSVYKIAPKTAEE
jgi:carbonic anhydrase